MPDQGEAVVAEETDPEKDLCQTEAKQKYLWRKLSQKREKINLC
jgi:hypothetical protein